MLREDTRTAFTPSWSLNGVNDWRRSPVSE